MAQENALKSKWNSEQAIGGVYRDLIITSADSGSGKMEGSLNSFDLASRLPGGGAMSDGVFHYEVSSQGSTLKFKIGDAKFNLKADDRTFKRLHGDVTFGDGTVEGCAFKKQHS